MNKGRDLPLIRRYLGVLIETLDADKAALALHINSMGSVAALGCARCCGPS